MTVYKIPIEQKEDYLMHHGILGQRWGVRRFQNEDGSLTPAGKKRYYEDFDDEWEEKHAYDLSKPDDQLRYIHNQDYSWKERKQYNALWNELYDKLPIDVDVFDLGKSQSHNAEILSTAKGDNTKKVAQELLSKLNGADKKQRRELIDDFFDTKLFDAVLKDLGYTVNDDNREYIHDFMYGAYY